MNLLSTPRIGIKNFRLDGCQSYFVFDPSSREAVVIDPHIQAMEDYRIFIAENKLKPVMALDTHTHADHFSATHLFKSEYSCAIGMSHRTKSLRPTVRLKSGDLITMGVLRFTALETPGHTPDGMCFFGEGLVFTGDTLFIGSTGRTDFVGADPSQLWSSLHEVLGKLPLETLILPGHEYNDILFSSLETESKKNEHWKIDSLEKFVSLKRSESIPNPDQAIKKRIEFNLSDNPPAVDSGESGCVTACGTARADVERVAAINVEKYSQKLRENASSHLFLDVREPDEFQDGHMPGTFNVPASEVVLYLDELKRFKRVYVSCLSGGRSTRVAKTLGYVGLADVVNVTGGYQAWTGAGLPIEK